MIFSAPAPKKEPKAPTTPASLLVDHLEISNCVVERNLRQDAATALHARRKAEDTSLVKPR